MKLAIYIAVQTAFVALAGFAFWWRRYRKGYDWHCQMCGQPGRWRYQEYTLCGDQRCLDQAEAEVNWRRENP